MKPKAAVGIDPGIATGGMVLWNGETVLETQSLGVASIKNDVDIPDGDPVFVKTVIRAEKYVKKIIQTLQEWEQTYDIVIIGIETFIDLPSKKWKNEGDVQLWIKDRWKTPLVIGMLHPYLQQYNVHYQNPSILASYRDIIAQFKQKELKEEKITSSHLASSWCHADYAWENFLDSISV